VMPGRLYGYHPQPSWSEHVFTHPEPMRNSYLATAGNRAWQSIEQKFPTGQLQAEHGLERGNSRDLFTTRWKYSGRRSTMSGSTKTIKGAGFGVLGV
jgi:hypothetical protein